MNMYYMSDSWALSLVGNVVFQSFNGETCSCCCFLCDLTCEMFELYNQNSSGRTKQETCELHKPAGISRLCVSVTVRTFSTFPTPSLVKPQPPAASCDEVSKLQASSCSAVD